MPDLAMELQRQADAKRDYIAPSKRLSLLSNGRTEMILGDPFPVTDIANGQIADYLDIPKPGIFSTRVIRTKKSPDHVRGLDTAYSAGSSSSPQDCMAVNG